MSKTDIESGFLSKIENLPIAVNQMILSQVLFVLSAVHLKYYVEDHESPSAYKFSIYRQIGVALAAYLSTLYNKKQIKIFVKEEHIEIWMCVRVICLFLEQLFR